jgi:predicted dehydrogenase
MEFIRWGIIGCGAIARGFTNGLTRLPDARLEAVAARDPKRAAAFIAENDPAQQDARVLPDYQSLIEDPDVDVVYIATTHHNHVALAHAAIGAGKPVLVEKPVGLHASEVEGLIAAARSRGIFLMEAMWMRFLPAFQAFQDTLASGIIGPVQLVQADFGIDIEAEAHGRMLNPALGGGSLWDLGIYPVTFARLAHGADPVLWQGFHQPAPETGVDQQAVIIGNYPDGGLAQLQCGFRMKVPHQARVYGPKGASCSMNSSTENPSASNWTTKRRPP